MSLDIVRLAILLGSVLTMMGCAGSRWRDEPGREVPRDWLRNDNAVSAFIEGLAAKRRETPVPEPMLTPSQQADIRKIADELQAGRLSAPRALVQLERWGRVSYRREIEAWLLDCGPGTDVPSPGTLIDRPVAVISIAAAHFRPVSAQVDQCALLVVSANGSDTIAPVDIARP